MDHAPFIIAAYSVAAILLTWCAFAPVVAGRKLRANLRKRYEETNKDHASRP